MIGPEKRGVLRRLVSPRGGGGQSWDTRRQEVALEFKPARFREHGGPDSLFTSAQTGFHRECMDFIESEYQYA